jgi:peptide/nickel transport system ATP-binding protein
VPQDPGNSLNPVKTIGAQVGEVLHIHQKISARERDSQVLAQNSENRPSIPCTAIKVNRRLLL